MNNYRKNTGLAVLAAILGLGAFPFSYSEAQSAGYPFSAQECAELGELSADKMDDAQMQIALQCDMIEASHDWEQQYGSLSDRERLAGLVHE